MSTNGIIRCADNIGRIVIPKEWRNLLKIGPKDPVEMLMRGDAVIIRKYMEEGQIKQFVEEIRKTVNESGIDFKHKSEIMVCLQAMDKLLAASFSAPSLDPGE